MKFPKQITINAPAEKVWGVVGRDFANVGQWATSIAKSTVNHEAPVVNGSPVGGRVCDTSIGHISEEFVAYDDQAMTLTFKGVITSKMFNEVLSTNEVRAIDANTSEIIITPEIDLTLLGTLMTPLIKMQLSKTLDEVLADLKYYVENGKISPSKVAAMAKQ